ncbi:NlpC/P60 family protein [Alteribacillus iranensis]|uniref:Cell wall-associated hydrolase, NlpC family n=1 Tax=Alteribacillus iranensis TaxID=930128 RepID=A0A1I2BXG1_9BACI|nr:NlpC/P60 family protein [Alteribacillus iranensis]SFE60797.1 Cell wall-associated hydrolase, NlpC family [Alteribacillus iranensis]
MKMEKYLFAIFIFFFIPVPGVLAHSPSFSDVTGDFWAKEEIKLLAEEGIISGYEDGTFRPNHPVKRSQAASMIVEALDLETANKEADFSDIDESFHAYDVAATVQQEGIITGRNGRFMPNHTLTRGQMAAVLNRSFEFSKAHADFADVDEDYVFYQDISNIAEAGVTTGYSEDHTFRPNNDTTRAQFSVFLARAMDDSGEFLSTSNNSSAAQLAQESVGENTEDFITSEFVQFAYREAENISLPRSASDQWLLGKSIEQKNVQPGDVVFFQGTYLMSGIYIDNGEFVIVTSDGISKRNMETSDYWSNAYVGAKRYTEENLHPGSSENDLVEQARALIGSPYNEDGEDPESGFSTGSLVHYVYEEVTGSWLSKRPAGLYDAGEKISQEELRPGDLVFFEGSSGLISGMYTGDRQFVIASSSGVKERHLDYHTYYADRYAGAVRYTDEILEKSNPDTYADHENPIIREAIKYMGTPYLMTGSTRDAFDCSFLIQSAFRDAADVYLPRISYKQWEVGETILDAGTDINSIELDDHIRPGDVLYFSGTWQEGISHTAIYLGEDHVIHATGEEGETTISYMNEYWKEHFTGVKRFDDLSVSFENEAVFEAYQLLGTEYQLGGDSPEEGFDTGGLVQYVYKEGLNIDLPRYGRQQWEEGNEIPRDEIEAGDLMFFEGSSIIPAVYIGNNQIIVATQASGVAVVDLTTSSYWPPRYIGSRTYDRPSEERRSREAHLAEDREGETFKGTSSEFIQQLYEEGSQISLPSTMEELRQSGEDIHIEELERGDLMIFGEATDDNTPHLAAIYLGEGRFATVLDRKIVITDMNTDQYWIQRLLEGRQITK